MKIIGLGRIMFGIKIPDESVIYAGYPPDSIFPFVNGYSLERRKNGVRSVSPVSGILEIISYSNVFSAIVKTISIYMVNLVDRSLGSEYFLMHQNGARAFGDVPSSIKSSAVFLSIPAKIFKFFINIIIYNCTQAMIKRYQFHGESLA